MATNWEDTPLLNQLKVGISIVTWYPEDPTQMTWVFINDARCRMTGFTREEILSKPPTLQASRETRALIQQVNRMIREQGSFSTESTLLDNSNTAIPVKLHMTLIDGEDGPCLLTEHHDLSAFKEMETALERSRESSLGMLTLIDKGKQQMTGNIRDNLGMVLFPLIDQLKISASPGQREILDYMIGRITQLTREIGITEPAGSFQANLTRRQILICEMIRDGMTSKDLAMALGCSASTINNHRNTIRRKLGLTGKTGSLQAYLNRTEPGND